MTTVPNSPPAASEARPPLTREQLLFFVANVLSSGVTAPIRMDWSELPSGREFEMLLPDDDRHAVNLHAAAFGLLDPRECAPVAGRRARRWYGTSSVLTQQPLFGGWRIAINCYLSPTPVAGRVPAPTLATAPSLGPVRA